MKNNIQQQQISYAEDDQYSPIKQIRHEQKTQTNHSIQQTEEEKEQTKENSPNRYNQIRDKSTSQPVIIKLLFFIKMIFKIKFKFFVVVK